MASGDHRATWRIATTRGPLVVRADIRPDEAERWVRAVDALAVARVPAPPARAIEVDGTTWLVMDEVQGDPGPSWLDTPDRARTLARSMGAMWRRLQAVDADGLRGILPMTGTVSGSFVHGDFAPINVIVDSDGDIAGLLDFEHARLGDPLDDLAWWGWVVRHHHPAAWQAAWPSLGAAAGLDVIELGSTLRTLMLGQLRRRVEATTDVRDRARWRQALDEASAW
jgi:aminoglycoside phosphotransferase (APT) family kinase protein